MKIDTEERDGMFMVVVNGKDHTEYEEREMAFAFEEGFAAAIIESKPTVNHPSHYNRGKMEAIDFIEGVGHGDGFALGNAIKYLIRYDAKDDRESNLRKAFWYLDRVAKKRLGEDRRPFHASAWMARIDEVAEFYPYLPRQIAETIALVGYARRPHAARDCLLNFLEVEGIAPEVDR